MSTFISLKSLGFPQGTWHLRRKEILPASPSRVWQALIDPLELALWWCDVAEVEARPGGRYAFGGPHVYGYRHGDPLAPTPRADRDFEIIDLAPESHLEYRWWLGEAETRVLYELENRLEQTELTVTHSAERAPSSILFSKKDMPDWWWVAMPALRSHIEKGKADLRIEYDALQPAQETVFQVAVTTFPWVIWQKLTDPRELERWWAKKAEVDLRPNGTLVLGLEGMGPRKVLEVDEGRRLLHDWAWSDGTVGRIEWLVEETEEATRLSVKDLGPWDPSAARDLCSIYWAATLLNLKQMSERGITPREYQDAFGRP